MSTQAAEGWRGRVSRYGVLRGNRPLQALWGSRLVSRLGDWSARVALVMLVYGRTDSALWAALTVAATYAPYLGPGQLLSTLADRLPHRTVLIGTDLVRLPVFVVLALLPLHPALVVAFAFVACIADVPSNAAFQAAVPMVAGKERYSDAMVLFGTTAQLSVLVGFAGGGALTTFAGARGVLLINAATFLVAALMLLRLPVTCSGAETARAHVHLAQSVRIVASDRLVAVTLAVVAVSCVGQLGIDSLTVVYAHHIGWGNGVGIGLLYVVMPVAAIVTGFFLPSGGDPVKLARLVVGSNIALSLVSVVAFLVAGSTPVGIVGIAAQGVLDMMVTPLFVIAEERIPATHRGTVFGFFQTCFMGMQLLGALVAGTLTEVAGIEMAFALGCLPAAVLGLLTWRLLRARPGVAATAEPVPAIAA